MEKIFDLLNEEEHDKSGLNLRETKKGQIFVEGLRKKKSLTVDQVLKDLEIANHRRKINETTMNGRSSRSHFIICFEAEIKYNMDVDTTKQQLNEEDFLKKNYY